MHLNTFVLAALQKSLFTSNPYALRSRLAAASKVVPLPAHGSITTSPLSVKIDIICSNRGTGFCVG